MPAIRLLLHWSMAVISASKKKDYGVSVNDSSYGSCQQAQIQVFLGSLRQGQFFRSSYSKGNVHSDFPN